MSSLAAQEQEVILSKQRNNNIFQIPDSNLWLITARDDAEHAFRANGALIGRVACASLPTADKARVSIIISNDHLTTNMVSRTKRFALHLLDAKQRNIAQHFGYASGHTMDKFADRFLDDGLFKLCYPLDSTSVDGLPQLPIIDGACGWMECAVTHSIEFPDSTLFVGAIQRQTVFTTDEVLSSKFPEIVAGVAHNCDKWPLTRRLLYAQAPELFHQHRQNIAKDIVTHHAKIDEHEQSVATPANVEESK